MVLQEFTELILSNSFVTFEDKVYVTKEGIPTGNCISRQVADCHMHYIIMKKIAPQMQSMWNLIGFWRRYILMTSLGSGMGLSGSLICLLRNLMNYFSLLEFKWETNK